MGWFSNENKRVPDTIGKKRGEDLRRKGAKEPLFTKKAVDRRKASQLQRGKSWWN